MAKLTHKQAKGRHVEKEKSSKWGVKGSSRKAALEGSILQSGKVATAKKAVKKVDYNAIQDETSIGYHEVKDTKQTYPSASVLKNRKNKPTDQTTKWTILDHGKKYVWSNALERVELVRRGIPSTSVEYISRRLNQPLSEVLKLVQLTPDFYKTSKTKKSNLSHHKSELVLLISELIDYGIEVFNNEESKFQNWLTIRNYTLGGATPISLFDSASGIAEVNKCLARIDSGNLA